MIKADDVVLHKPSGETWVVCGVDHAAGELIPCGYPFPTVAKLADCELVSPSKTTKQPREFKDCLLGHGLDRFVENPTISRGLMWASAPTQQREEKDREH